MTTEITLNEQIEACEWAATTVPMTAGVMQQRLRAAARTLRAMQGKEQSDGQPKDRARARLPADAMQAGSSDPPPPEDALLAELTAWLEGGLPPMLGWENRAMITRARDRIIELQQQVKHGTLPAD